MKREVIPFVTEHQWLSERDKDISSTLVAAVCGLDPQISRFALWHHKHRGAELPFKENERTRAGKMLQAVIAQMAAEDLGREIEPMTEYMRLPELRLGSSFDNRTRDCELIIECKNVDAYVFRTDWIEEEGFGTQASTKIEAQIQTQFLVSGIHRGFIAALVGGNRLVLLERNYDPVVGDAIMKKVAAFWAEKAEPEPWFPRDAAFVASLYGYSEPGKVVEADEETAALFREYAGYRATAKAADDNADTIKAQILMRIGDAEKVTHPEFTLSAKLVKAAHIAYDRREYRGFKLTERKS